MSLNNGKIVQSNFIWMINSLKISQTARLRILTLRNFLDTTRHYRPPRPTTSSLLLWPGKTIHRTQTPDTDTADTPPEPHQSNKKEPTSRIEPTLTYTEQNWLLWAIPTESCNERRPVRTIPTRKGGTNTANQTKRIQQGKSNPPHPRLKEHTPVARPDAQKGKTPHL